MLELPRRHNPETRPQAGLEREAYLPDVRLDAVYRVQVLQSNPPQVREVEAFLRRGMCVAYDSARDKINVKVRIGLLASDPALVVFLVLLAACVGTLCFFGVGGIGPMFGPSLTLPPFHFGPCVMVALGKGLVEPVPSEIPALERFLKQEKEALSPEELPAELTLKPPYLWYRHNRFLCYTVGLTWRFLGISWRAVKILLIAMCCITAPLVYGLFRLGMNRFWGMAGAILFLARPGFLAEISNLRELSKAPFFLSVMLLLFYLLKKPVSVRAFLGLAALLGLIVGIGLGFRVDVLICLAPSLLTLLFCARGETKKPLLQRLVAATLLLGCFGLVSYPIREAYRKEGLVAHDVIMGMGTVQEDRLGMARASYERQYLLHDQFAFATAHTYAHRVMGWPEPIAVDTPEQDWAGRKLILDVVKTFPADLITRAYAGVLWVIGGAVPEYPELPAPVLAHATRRLMPYFAVTVLLLLSCRDLRLAYLTLLLSLYFFGYISIQFQNRHAFHLGFAFYWILGFLADRLVFALGQLRHNDVRQRIRGTLSSPRRWWSPPACRMLVFAAGASIVVFVPVYAARLYQVHKVGRLLDQYEAADLAPLETEERFTTSSVIFHLKRPLASQFCTGAPYDRSYRDDYLVLELAAAPKERSFELVYAAENAFTGDFSWTLTVLPTGQKGAGITRKTRGCSPLSVAPTGEKGAGTTKYFFPVYEVPPSTKGTWSRFVGVALPKTHAQEFKGLYRVVNKAEFSLLLNMTLPADRTLFRPYQNLLPAGARVEHYCTPMPGAEEYPWFPAYLAGELRKRGDYDGAIEHFEAELAKRPMDIGLLVGLGRALDAKGDWRAARQTYEQAVAADPAFYAPCDYLDDVLRAKLDLSDRVAAWRKVACAHPDASPPYVRLAVALAEAEDIEGAIEAYRTAIQLNPCDVATLARLGPLLRERGHLDEAIEVYQKAVALNPRNAELRTRLVELVDEKRIPQTGIGNNRNGLGEQTP